MTNKSTTIYYILTLISLTIILLSGCQNIFLYGVKPQKIDKSIPYQEGILRLEEEKIDVRYIISYDKSYEKKSSDILFYFHGMGRTELDWIDEKGFGRQYYKIIKTNPELKSIPVVSISFGLVYLMYKELPYPFETDLEEVFIKKVIPYFQKKLNCHGNTYLLGHSLGGYNALILSLRHPEIFPAVVTISPFVMPFSPFSDSFEKNLEAVGLKKILINTFKRWYITIFKNEKNWLEYSPYYLLDNPGKKPIIFLSSAESDYPGFKNLILIFENKLKEKNIPFVHFSSNGTHKTTDDKLIYQFLTKANELSNAATNNLYSKKYTKKQ